MQVGVMITNGGPHSPEKWAAATSGEIIKIAADASEEEVVLENGRRVKKKRVDVIDGRRIELRIMDVLADVHRNVQEAERSKIVADPTRADEKVPDPFEHDIEATTTAICATANGTMFEEYFGRPAVKKHIREVLASHFATSMHIERSWHRDRSKTAA